LCGLREEVRHEQFNITPSFPKGRAGELYDADAVVQILAEGPVSDALVKSSPGRSDDPNVDSPVVLGSDGSEGVVFE
jgi:hypothetical protein